ncbi:hypothetical protein BG004_002514 [Podila humilis]|nr:hypothetical protein BG004_002514 [Podila humilis]
MVNLPASTRSILEREQQAETPELVSKLTVEPDTIRYYLPIAERLGALTSVICRLWKRADDQDYVRQLEQFFSKEQGSLSFQDGADAPKKILAYGASVNSTANNTANTEGTLDIGQQFQGHMIRIHNALG